MALAGALIITAALISLRHLTLHDWTILGLLAGLIVVTSSRPLRIPNVESAISVSDVFIFLGLFFLGAGPAVLLGALDNLIASRRMTKCAAIWIMSPNLMAITTLCSSTAFYWMLAHMLGSQPRWPIGEAQISVTVLLPALAALALVQYAINSWLVAMFYALRASASPYLFWRSNYLWTSWTFFASAAAAGLVYLAVEYFGVVFVLVGLPIIAASYLTYKTYFERLNEKIRHIEEVSRLHMATAEALATAIDAKDQTSHGHVRRVQIYAEGLARIYKLSEAEIQALRTGALLHDVGKLAVPDHILNKPGKLTEAEFEKMKIHPVVGAQILERVGFPYPVIPIIRHHHERWDGTGYPDGLKAEAIPLTARILSVVDCYDAAREHRQYRRGLTREQALDLLRRASGTHFDPHVVEMFIKHLPEFEAQIAAQQIELQQDQEVSGFIAFDPATGPLWSPELTKKTRSDLTPSPNYLHAIGRAHQEVYALYEVARTFGSSLNIEDAMAIIANKLGYMVPFETCVIYRYHEGKEVAVAEHVTGAYAEFLRGRRIYPGGGLTGYVLTSRQPLVHPDPMPDFSDVELPRDAVYRAAAVCPLIKEGRLLGALALYSMTLPAYTDDHMRLLETVSRIASDALDNAIRYAETKVDALTDQLTGLPNSRALQLRFDQEADRADRADKDFYLLMFDLDNFKPINDTYGHPVGDDFLRSISRLLSSHFRERDFFSRYAGDEFVALVGRITEEECQQLCERLQRAVEQFVFCVRPMKYARVGVSIGTALYGRDGETLDALLLKADQAMYANKSRRKLMAGTNSFPPQDINNKAATAN
jgi:diguanylate cyclase (GGDEF)-like protein/putative nucleotidyltransferase with HDIG domain